MAFNPGKGGYPGGRQGWQQPTLPEGYLKSGYFEPATEGERPALRREFIIGYPEKIARALEDREKNKSTQLRKFYDYCIRIRDMLDRGRPFHEVESDFCRLAAFAGYAESRGKVNRLFVEFIQENVDTVRSKEDFYAFLKHFEAVIAYIKK